MHMKAQKKVKDEYGLDDVNYMDIAEAMDFINEYTLKVYCGYYGNKIADPYEIQQLLYNKKKKMNSIIFQFVIDIMTQEDYIDVVEREPNSNCIKCFRISKRGIDHYFKGGFKQELIKKRREKWLMINGQVSIILAGFYYLTELLKNVFPNFIIKLLSLTT